MPEYRVPPLSSREVVAIDEVIAILWRGKWIIFLATVIAAIVSVVVALILPDVYRAQALLAPAKQQSGGGVDQLAQQFGGLAGLAGIDLAGGKVIDEVDYALELVQSQKFFSDFISRHDGFLVELMAVEAWDPLSGELKINTDIYDKDAGEWVRNTVPPKLPRPSVQEAHRVFKKKFSAERKDDTGFIIFSFDHASPQVAKKWIDFLVKDLNETIRKQDMDEALRAIEYLEHKLDDIGYAQVRVVFTKLIEEQTKTVMLANIRPEYSLRTIDPAVVPELHDFPNRPLICVLGTAFGGILGILIVLLRSYFRRKK